MRTCFQRVCEPQSSNGAIDLTKERGVYNLYVQVAGGDGNVGGPSAGKPVRPRELSVPSDGGEEVIAPSACEADTGRAG